MQQSCGEADRKSMAETDTCREKHTQADTCTWDRLMMMDWNQRGQFTCHSSRAWEPPRWAAWEGRG